MDHVDLYLDMLQGFLLQAGIEVLGPRSQVAGPEVPGCRLVAASIYPKIQEENAMVLENAFERFNWSTVVKKGEFMHGTKFLMTDMNLKGRHEWKFCDQPEIFMALAALGLSGDKKEMWWVASGGAWCPVLCCVCERRSQWWW